MRINISKKYIPLLILLPALAHTVLLFFYFSKDSTLSLSTALLIVISGTLVFIFVYIIFAINKASTPVELSKNILEDKEKQIQSTFRMAELIEKLKTSETNLNLLVETATDAIWSIDASMKLLTVNSYGKELCKKMFDVDISVGMELDEYVPIHKFPEANLYWRRQFQKALNGEKFSTELVTKIDSKESVLLISYYPVHRKGRIDGVAIFTKNITEKKEIAFELKKSLSLLSATFESSNDGYLSIDKEGKISNFNKRFAKMWNLPIELLEKGEDELAIKHVLSQVISPEEFQNKIKYLYKVQEEESYDIIEFKDGKFFERYSLPQKLNNQIIGRVWAFRDITSRIIAEKQLKKATEEITDLYNNAPCGYHSIDASGLVLSMNNTQMNWLGYTKADIDKKLYIKEFLDKGSVKKFNSNFELVKSGKELLNIEYNFVRKDKTIMPVLANSSAVVDSEGRFLKTRTTIYNISERIRYEKELLRSKFIAEEALKFREQFLANVSHEIRTPLSGISGLINLMKETKLDSEQEAYIYAMKSSSDNLIVIINDLLDLSKIDAGQMKLDEFEFILHDVTQSVYGLLKPRAVEKRIDFQIHIENNVPKNLLGDPVRISQILVNLINNSIKFTERGEVSLNINIQGTTENIQWIRFQVSDTGIGIPSNKLDSIFESFTQAGPESTSTYGGIGLGLAIVKKLVDLQKGTIQLESTLGIGSTFSIDLPFKTIYQNNSNGSNQIIQKQKQFEKSLEHARILLAEDDPANQLLTKRLLQKRGIKIELASNGKICLDMALKYDYDLILMDIQMPEMNGYEALMQIRNNFPFYKRDIPIIAITARATSNEKEKCLKMGMSDYLSKPFSPELLFRKLERHILGRNKYNTLSHNSELEEPAQISNSKLINLNYLNDLADGSNEFIIEMIQYFIIQTPKYLEEMEHGCKNEKWDVVQNVAHRMKPSLIFVGIQSLIPVIDHIELNAEAKTKLKTIEQQIEILKTTCLEAIVELHTELERFETNR